MLPLPQPISTTRFGPACTRRSGSVAFAEMLQASGKTHVCLEACCELRKLIAEPRAVLKKVVCTQRESAHVAVLEGSARTLVAGIEAVPLRCRVGVELVLEVLRDGRAPLTLDGGLRKLLLGFSPGDLVPVCDCG